MGISGSGMGIGTLHDKKMLLLLTLTYKHTHILSLYTCTTFSRVVVEKEGHHIQQK